MDVGDGFNFSFEQQSGNSLSCQSLPMFSAQRPDKFVGTNKSLMSVRKEASSPMTTPFSSADVAEQFLVDQNVDFDGSGGLSSYNVRISQSQGNSNSNTAVEQFQRSSIFNNESIPEAVNSFDLLKSSQISSALCPPDFHFVNKHGIEKNLKGKKRKSLSECGALRPHSSHNSVQQKNVPPESVKSSIEKDEKKQKTEDPGGTSPNPTAKHTKEYSQDGDTPNEDYIHVRAKRGQATNSHSLAERLRREKISERMKLLQDLVPGCNKITGKAMMLDEIINYVQSLQRQVQFLSMKLAAVNPELQFDIEQILSNNVLHSQEGSLDVFGCVPGINTFHPHLPPQGIVQPEMLMCIKPNSGDIMRSGIPQLSPMAQLSGVWDDDLQTVLQMGFIPDPYLSGSDPNGSTKMEL